MDKLSIFAREETTTEDITEGIDSVVSGQEKILEQLQVTHLGHEEQDWGKEYTADDLLLDVDETEEE